MADTASAKYCTETRMVTGFAGFSFLATHISTHATMNIRQ